MKCYIIWLASLTKQNCSVIIKMPAFIFNLKNLCYGYFKGKKYNRLYVYVHKDHAIDVQTQLSTHTIHKTF